MSLNIKVCENCIAERNRKQLNLLVWDAHAGDRIMRHGIVKCRKKWLSAACSEAPDWCRFRLEHIVSEK
jgi:hypothetical protein